MKHLMHKIKAIFKIARLVSVDDSGNLQQGVFTYMGSNPKGQVFIPYGILMNPPIGSQMAVFTQNGNESNAIGLASDPNNRPLKNLEPGEFGISNYLTGDTLLMKADGTVELTTSKLIITTGVVQVIIDATGLAITGGDVTHNGTTIGDDHIHSQGNDSDGDSEVDTGGPHG